MRPSSAVRRTLSVALVITLLVGGLAISTQAASATPPVAPAGLLTTITPGLTGYDSLGVSTQTQTDCLSTTAGYSFATVNTNGMADANGAAITTSSGYQQYNAAAATGMKLVLFQGYGTAANFWTTTNNGNARGITAVLAAHAVRYPTNAMIFLNLEATTAASHTQVLTFVQQWIAAVRIRNYLPGIYLGANAGLSAADLNALGKVVYWKSPSTSGVPTPARGYVLQQPYADFERATCNVTVDGDVAGSDSTGATLIGAAFPTPVANPTVPGAFKPLTPTRLLDTRTGNGGSGPVGSTKVVDLQVTGRGGVPSRGVAGVVMNITVTAPTRTGYITVYPTGAGRPGVSTLNFTPNLTVANLATVPVSPTTGKVSLYNGSGGTVQLIADVAGYYLSGTATAPGTYVPVPQTRALNRVIASWASATLPRSTVSSHAFDSVVLNATAVNPAGVGFVTAYPASMPKPPNASNLNFVPGQTVANMVTVQSDADGIAFYNGSTGRSQVLADLSGYYNSGHRVDTGAFTPLSPTRILDTRSNNGHAGKIASASGIALRVRGNGGVPGTATAVVLNVTVTGPSAAGYLTVFPSDTSAPVASNINFAAGQTIPNEVIVPIGADGQIVLDNQSVGTTNVVADVAGYFTT